MRADHRLLRNSSRTPPEEALLANGKTRPRDEQPKAHEEQPLHDEQPKAQEEFSTSLPGELMMWVLILSELAVFGAGLLALLATRLTDSAGFGAAQAHLHRVGAGVNTVVLVTSGYLAAKAVPLSASRPSVARGFLVFAAALGGVFLTVKAREYADLFAQGIGTETHPFFTFSFLLTGFHAAHVLAGMVLLLAVAFRPTPRPVETVAAFWHMVDLVWVLLVPVVYLL